MSSSPAWTSEQDPVSGSSSPKEESRRETEGTLSLHSLVHVSVFLVKAGVHLTAKFLTFQIRKLVQPKGINQNSFLCLGFFIGL